MSATITPAKDVIRKRSKKVKAVDGDGEAAVAAQKEKEDDISGQNTVKEFVEDTKRSKRRKKDQETMAAEESKPLDRSTHDTQKDKTKKKHRNREEGKRANGEATKDSYANDEKEKDDATDVTRKKKKDKKDLKSSLVEADTATLETSGVADGVKDKKRKRKDRSEPEEGAELQADQPPKKTKKKRRDVDPAYPDPAKDTTLSEQSRKALCYASECFEDPSGWKFNKARQNWLVRNTWSDEAIPDTYVPLLVRYLTDVKGGTRDKLIEVCKSALSPPALAPTLSTSALPSSAPPPTASSPNPTGMRESRARTLLDALIQPTSS
ncbi:hypothetical protein BV22DRAFT_1027538 [Leucogyrophana mollusca]|uniref:Uncharacterized protein n=1 Tax=Leucogyrophana mollusca TaxID=85980 RepID=A0ACB8C1R6_9AGAM|nr:hypothetical protein BV22DRAFT_1027538 [Leucogyrophana mollusca]